MNPIPKFTFFINGITIEYCGIFDDGKSFLEFVFYSHKDFKSDFIITDTFQDYTAKIHIGKHSGIDLELLHDTIRKLSKYYHFLANENYVDFWNVYKYLIIVCRTAEPYPWINKIVVNEDLEEDVFKTMLNKVKVDLFSNKHNEKQLEEGLKMFLESEYE